MSYAKQLHKIFPNISLEVEDFFLLESFQIAYLPERLPSQEFAALIHYRPQLKKFFIVKHPPIAGYLNEILDKYKPPKKQENVEKLVYELVWEIGDLIVYNKYPNVYDKQVSFNWDLDEITSIVPLEGKVVIDAGAGTGRLAFSIAPLAKTVFAVEPVTSLRQFIKEKALSEKSNNIFVIDGFLSLIPLPENTADVLITSQAIGWNLEDELKEIERVVKPGGYAIHLLGYSDIEDMNELHDYLTNIPWGYDYSSHKDNTDLKRKYWKIIK